MENFELYNPTRILFGKDQFIRLPELLKEHITGGKIMIAYGGGSVLQNGILNRVKSHLNGHPFIAFGGIEPNPQYTTLMKGVELAREEGVTFILAVGGGSVIDGVKFMAGAFFYQGEAWDVLARKEGCVFNQALPFGCVLTLPATGSEANSGAVISRDEIGSKRTMGGPQFFPKFSLCDPTVVATLPKRQIANGIIDAFTHTMEQYITFPTQNHLQERQAEAILSVLIEIAPVVLNDPSDYSSAANLMWCATNALTGQLRCGVPTDWATHMIGHELTALYGIDHARTLAIIAPRLYENQFENKKEKLAQYGKRIWGLAGNDNQIGLEAIRKTEEFFHSLHVPTKLSEYTSDTDHAAGIIRNRFIERGWIAMGERQAITPDDVFAIVENSI
jgi:NADP-dependent alcohol dehydrogenase